MATANIYPKIVYTGNGSRDNFPFNFPAPATSDISVYIKRGEFGKQQKLTRTDYNFISSPDLNNGGEIRFPIPGSQEKVLGENDKLCIIRTTENGNAFTFSDQTRLYPSSVEDADDTLALQILDLRAKLDQCIQADVFNETEPEKIYRDLMDATKALIDNIQDVGSVRDALDQEIADRTEADNKRIDKDTLPSTVVGLAGQNTPSQVAIKVSTKDTTSGVVSESTVVLPVSNVGQHGVMPKESFATLVDLVNRVGVLEGGVIIYAVHLGTAPVSQEQYQIAWEQASGKEHGTIPIDGTSLLNLDNNLTITYFSNQAPNQWTERGTTIGIANESVAGVVKSTTSTSGKIMVENDGTMSVNGWDAVESITQKHDSDIEALDRSVVHTAAAATIYGKIKFVTIPRMTKQIEFADSVVSTFPIIGKINVFTGSDGVKHFDLVVNEKNTITAGEDTNGNVFTNAITPSVSSNNQSIATTEYINNKFKEVSALPENPDPNVWYAIME